ncbi:MAG: BBP7 family outer membrane beta-barrel protein [Planctomycetota bacterium]
MTGLVQPTAEYPKTDSLSEDARGGVGKGRSGETLRQKLDRLVGMICRTTFGLATATACVLSNGSVSAAPPTAASDVDYSASGFELPKGAVLPATWMPPMAGGGPVPGTVAPIATTIPNTTMLGGPMMASQWIGHPTFASGDPMFANMGMVHANAPYGVAPIGYYGGMSSCDSMDGCSTCCPDGTCNEGGGCQFDGLLPTLLGNGNGCGCASCASGVGSCLGEGGILESMRDGECINSDMGILASNIGGCMAGLAECLRPFSEGGRCAQRWYDVSVEALVLTQNLGGLDDALVLAHNGNSATPGVADDPALTVEDIDGDGLTLGARISLAMIMGPGGNIEGTYMGGNHWSGEALATSNGPRLTSVFSLYGNTPTNGFGNASDFQSASTEADFHSAEINYRRRVVGPYCRFQGSWLVGMRYVRYDNNLDYNIFGNTLAINQAAFDLDTDNRFFGGQVGFDMWYNAAPGITIGTGLKGAWGVNDWVRRTSVVVPTTVNNTVDDYGEDVTILMDLNTTLVYRFSYSCSFRTSYHLIAMDDVQTPSVDASYFSTFSNSTTEGPAVNEGSLVLQGFTTGIEYLW